MSSLRVNRHFAVALKEIRAATTIAAWMIGIAIVVQIVTWSLATMTEIRFVEHEETATMHNAESLDVVTPTETQRERLRSVGSAVENETPVDPNRQLAAADQWLGSVTNISAAFGTMGALALLPLIGLGVILAAGSATHGVEKTSGAFVWAVVLLSLCIPWSVVFEQVPFQGLFSSYDTLTTSVEAYRSIEHADGEAHTLTTTIMFYGRHGLLPLAALLGVIAVALRFRAGVEAGLFPREDYRLDPALEAEIATIKTSNLVGSGNRSAGAMRGLIAPDDASESKRPATTAKGKAKPAPDRPIKAPTAGQPERRPI